MKEYKNTKKQNEPNLGKHGGLPLLRTPNNELRTFLSKRTHFLLEAGGWPLEAICQNEPNFPIFQQISRVIKTCIPVFLHTCIPVLSKRTQFGKIGKGDLSFSNVWFWGIMVG
jgi:hypothetical protein